jgi:universal stress protein E
LDNLKKILVGLDFSSGSSKALEEAVNIALTNQAELYVLHIIDSHVVEDLISLEHASRDEILKQCKEELDHILKNYIENNPTITFHLAIDIGNPLEKTLAKIKEINADLIILGVKGVSNVGTEMGSFSISCIRKAPCKVLIIDSAKKNIYNTVLACVDFSAGTDQILGQALKVCKTYNANLKVLHTYFPPWKHLSFRTPSVSTTPQYRAEYMKMLQVKIDHSLDKLKEESKGVSIKTEILEKAHHGSAIVDYARTHDIDLIVLSTRGRSSFMQMLLGTTAERIVRETPCSVLALKPIK